MNEEQTAKTSACGDLKYAYLFEAKGIQKYILASGRLRDVVGASDRVAQIASSDEKDLLATVESAVPPNEFSRRGGGAFCAHFADRDTAEKFRALWRLTIANALPGLEYADALEPTLDGAYAALGGVRENGAATVLPGRGAGQRVCAAHRPPGSAL